MATHADAPTGLQWQDPAFALREELPAAALPATDADDRDCRLLERVGLYPDVVPAIYRDTLVRLNRKKPTGVSEAAWLQARADAQRFVDTWGWVSLQSAGWDWTAVELFDVPRGSDDGGLIWKL